MRHTDLVLLLHSHLPYVLNHGRWPHGSDWLCEAVIDSYLPLVGMLNALERADIAAPLTISVTPVLAAQLAHPTLHEELARYFDARLAHCDEVPTSLRNAGDEHLVPLVEFWRLRLVRLRLLYHEIGRDLVGALRRLQDRGRIEVATSAATHAFLPLLGRDESIRLQLALGCSEYRRHFGRESAGCWLPECGYRPRGRWSATPEAPPVLRRGIDEHLATLGFGYFFVDAHTAHAGRAPDTYGEFDAGRATGTSTAGSSHEATNDPHRAYLVGPARPGRSPVAFVRDPEASARVWSRHGGYPGASPYLEFHKIRWPGGLRLWRVTDATGDLGAKQPYDPAAAGERAEHDARHFAGLLGAEARRSTAPDGVIAVPFDTELFGHWWFEGPEWLGNVFRQLSVQADVQPTTASAHLEAHPAGRRVQLVAGSWGRQGDFSMWMNDRVRWMWRVVWDTEERFWSLAPRAMEQPAARELLAQAARELLLLQSSDWPFIVTTGEASDYATARFDGHANDARVMLDGVQDVLQGLDVTRAREMGRALWHRDAIFEEVLPAVQAALDSRRTRHRPARLAPA